MNDARAIYEFGDFALDVARQQLLPLCGGEPVPLAGKTFEALVYLVEHANEPLDKDTLLRALWPDVVVEENSLTQIVSALRRTLGEKRGENRYIATLPRTGYRFVARVSKRTDPPTRARKAVVRSGWRTLAWIWGICALFIVAVIEYRVQSRAAALVYPRHETQDPDAFAAFASGRVAYLRLTEDSLTQAVGFYEQAVARDPGYARAHAGIADCHILRAVLGLGAPEVEYPQARIAVLKALQLDPALAAAHVSLGQIEIVHEHNLGAAERELSRAVELDPRYAPSYFYRGVLHTYRGNVAGALEAFDRAMQLDPLSLPTRAARALALFHARRYDESIASLHQILSVDEHFDLARGFLMRALLAKGEFALVLSEMQARPVRGPGSYGFIAEALALSGHREEALAALDRVLELSRRQHVPAFDIAGIYAALDDVENMFLWLERALDDSSPVGVLPLEPSFDKFHADPRFASLVARIRS
jgi:DNA-binding winged helix-turn-helix (wHTH) protein/tetratricopeptide (TPR) repeat protein